MVVNEKMIKPSEIRLWSTLGPRAVFGQTIFDIAKEREDVVAMTADMASSAGLSRMLKSMPDRVIDCGIAEQGMIGIATGLASMGYKVFTATFAPFQTMRCCEQIRVNAGYMGMPIKMTGLASGMIHGFLGNTHCCIEDISIMKSIPGITIISPADCTEVAKAVRAVVDYDRPVYLRLTGGPGMKPVYTEDYDFRIGHAEQIVSSDDHDMAILASGTMVAESAKAAELLKKDGIGISVYNMHTIRPLDTELLSSLENYRYIYVAEEHNITGGLGTSVADYYADKAVHPIICKIGISDEYPHAGDYIDILDTYGLTGEKICARIKKKYRGDNSE